MASDGYNSEALLRLKFQTLRLKACCLRILLSFGGKGIYIEDGNLQALLIHIRTVFSSIYLDLGTPGIFSESYKRIPMHMDDRYSRILERLELLNPDVQQVFNIISKSSRFITDMSHEAVMKHLNNLLKNIKDLMSCKPELVAPVKEELEAAQTGLRFLRNFLDFTAKWCNQLESLKDLVNHAESLVRNLSCLFYLCSANDRMNDWMMKVHLSFELVKFRPVQPEVREIYIKALKVSKSAQRDYIDVDEFDLAFFDSLRDHIMGLSDTKLSFIASDKDKILSLHEELRILIISFTIYKPSRAHGDLFRYIDVEVLEAYFLKRISAVMFDMGCLIYSLYNNEQNTDEAKELKIAVSNLQDIIKIAKKDSRKAYDKYISKSWRLKTIFRTTNAQGMIRSLMRILEKIRSHSSRSGSIRFHQFKVLQKEMQSLIGAFSNLTEKQHLEHGGYKIQMSRLNDIRDETESLISSLSEESRSVWNHNLWLFVLIGKIKVIKNEFKYLQNQMINDTSTSKLHRRMNPQGKKIMTDYAEIVEDEPERTGEQLINGSNKPHSLPVNVGLLGIEDGNSNLDLICPQKDEVEALRLKASFLKVFLSCKGMWHVEDGNLKVLLSRIHSVFQSVDQDLRRLLSDLNIQTSTEEVWCLPMNMDCLLSRLLSRHQLLEPDIQGAYAILLKSSIFITGISDEALVENLNTLLENIEVLLKCNTELVAPLKEELKAVQKSLRFLRNFLGFTAKRCSKLRKLKDLLMHSEFLAGKISCLLYLCCNNEKMNDQMVNEMKMRLSSELQMFSPAQPDVREIYIKALKASKSTKGNSNYAVLDEFVSSFLDPVQDDILELSNNNLSSIASSKEQILSLQKELKLLITFFTMDRSLEEYSEHNQISDTLFEHINAVIIDIGCVIYLLKDDENNEMMAREQNKKVSALVANFMAAKEDIRKIYDLYVPRPLQSDFPRTNGQGFVGSLFWNLNELLNTEPGLVVPLKHHIEIVQKELLSLREDFGKIAKQPSQCDEFQSQWTRFLDIAYQTEFIIDSFLVGGDSIYCHKLGLFNVLEEIKTIKIELKAIENKMTDNTMVQKPIYMSVELNFPGRNVVLSSKERLADENSTTELVIFGEEAEIIREQLTRGSKKLNILSIVGMPGIGKTTLADSVFQHSSVTYHFHVQARCSVSQVHDKRRLLLEVLQQVTVESKQDGDDDNDDLDQRLYQSLKGRRYLILMDDVWNIQPWEDVKALFPDDENGSRIIFTSRFEDIASQTVLGSTKFHLSPLSEEKSWEMLKVKLFGNKSCPPELVSVGHEIAVNCKGLPLTIDLVAGVLRTKERKEWRKVAESLMTILFEDPQGRCRKVLDLSYQNLPDDLKPCFLYFAAFPEDANVPTRDLILLWIAEGFVKLEKGETRSLEDVAKDILNNLIRRSLVTVFRRGPLGGVVASRVHDLLHVFAVAKAQEESFMLKKDGKPKFSRSSSVGVDDQWREQYRLCICSNYWSQFRESNPSGRRTRTLISSYVHRDAFSLICSSFKLLRVLYIAEAPFCYCPELFTLIHLRLLAISRFGDSDARNIIPNIHKLRNLETFIMHGGRFAEPDENLLLDKICNMVRLRHFCFGGYIHFRYLREEIWQKASFTKLRTLYNLRASYEEDIEKILKLMPNLVDLKVLFYNPGGNWYPFPKLDFLKKLESLEVTHQNYYDPQYPPYPRKTTSFPPHLQRLVLSNFCMPWAEISEIGNLEYLEVLELRKGAFRGPIWDMIDGQFPELKYLSLYDLDIKEWNASEDHLSRLEQLQVAKCRKLKDLPPCLAEIATLQAIEIFYCTEDVENSAKRIKKEQEQLRNGQFVVYITKKFGRHHLLALLREELEERKKTLKKTMQTIKGFKKQNKNVKKEEFYGAI